MKTKLWIFRGSALILFVIAIYIWEKFPNERIVRGDFALLLSIVFIVGVVTFIMSLVSFFFPEEFMKEWKEKGLFFMLLDFD